MTNCVLWLFLTILFVGLKRVIEVFSDYTYVLSNDQDMIPNLIVLLLDQSE